MPRRRRMDMAGVVVHVLNRAVRRALLFSTRADYLAFESTFRETLERTPLRILAFCVMPNHFHVVAWPSEHGQISRFMHWLTLAHACRWHAARGSTGTGAVYQGRFKSFPVEADDHVLRACRYVERNALRAGLVGRAEDWRWGSLWHRTHGDPARLLSAGPMPLPDDWVERVNAAESAAELEALRRCARRGRPFGTTAWTVETASEWGLLPTLHDQGRPRKTNAASEAATMGRGGAE